MEKERLNIKKHKERDRKERQIISRNKRNAAKERNYARSIGYKDLKYGIKSTIRKILSGEKSLNQSRGVLIKLSNRDSFTVSNIVGNYVIFNTFFGYELVQIAVVKSPEESYINKSRINGKYFTVVGKNTFTDALGSNKEILVLKRVL